MSWNINGTCAEKPRRQSVLLSFCKGVDGGPIAFPLQGNANHLMRLGLGVMVVSLQAKGAANKFRLLR